MGFEIPNDLNKKKNETSQAEKAAGQQEPEDAAGKSNAEGTAERIDKQKEFGLNNEQYEVFINLAKTEIINWPPKILDYFDNLDPEKMPKDGPEMAALVASQIKEQGLEREQSPAEKNITAEIAKEQQEISPGILSRLVPKKMKKAIGIGFASLSLFAASGAFSNADAGGPKRPSFGTQMADTVKQGLIGIVGSNFDRAIKSGYAEDQLRYQIEQQVAQREVQMHYQERQMEMNMRMQEKQMEMQERRMDRQMDRQIDMQKKQAEIRAGQAAGAKGTSNPANPETPSGAAF